MSKPCTPEQFTIRTDWNECLQLSCEVDRCLWETEIGNSGIGDDLGSLLAAARDHLGTAHSTEGDDG